MHWILSITKSIKCSYYRPLCKMLENDLRPTTYDVFKEWLSWNSFSLNFVFLCFKIVVKHLETWGSTHKTRWKYFDPKGILKYKIYVDTMIHLYSRLKSFLEKELTMAKWSISYAGKAAGKRTTLGNQWRIWRAANLWLNTLTKHVLLLQGERPRHQRWTFYMFL